MAKDYPIGVKDFRALVTGGYYFIDKTLMITDLCRALDRTFIYTRPRRFGKSINLSMLDYFFNIKYKDDKDIFAGMKISECHVCDEYRNKFPVIRLDLSSMETKSVDRVIYGLKKAVAEVAKDMRTSGLTATLTNGEKQQIDDLENRRTNLDDLQGSIKWMSEILERLYGEKVIILVDEYDRCIHDISDPNLFEEVSDIMRMFMQESFKTNTHIRFGVATGVMTVLQTGMFSGFNCPTVCDIFATDGDEYFGFTEEEVVKLLDDSEVDRCHLNEIREWYDGYRFGETDVYNPLSVIHYLKNNCKTSEYWNRTTRGGISHQLISNLDFGTMVALKNLVDDRSASIECTLDDRIVYADIAGDDVDPSEVYSYLAMAGYLKAVYISHDDEEGRDIYRVSMVNKEVTKAFKEMIERVEKMQNDAPINLKKDIYSGDADKIAKDIIILLSGRSMDKTWSHDRYKELLGGALDMQQMLAVDEMPKGLGKVDIFVNRTRSKPAVAIEIKTSSKEATATLAGKALNAILDKGYASEPMDREVISIGVGINIKDVAVRVIMPGEY